MWGEEGGDAHSECVFVKGGGTARIESRALECGLPIGGQSRHRLRGVGGAEIIFKRLGIHQSIQYQRCAIHGTGLEHREPLKIMQCSRNNHIAARQQGHRSEEHTSELQSP